MSIVFSIYLFFIDFLFLLYTYYYILILSANKSAVELIDFEQAMDRIIGGLEKKNKVMSQEEKRVVAHHEVLLRFTLLFNTEHPSCFAWIKHNGNRNTISTHTISTPLVSSH